MNRIDHAPCGAEEQTAKHIIQGCTHLEELRQETGPGGVMVERSLGVRKVVGSIPSRDIPKVVKRWYK